MAAPVITHIDLSGQFPVACDVFSQNIPVSNGPVTWSITAGALPVGYIIDDGFPAGNGAIQGNTTVPGVYTFTIRATNADGFDEWATGLTVASWQVPSIDPTPVMSPFTVTAFYNATILDIGAGSGLNCNTWSVVAGALPDGITIDFTFADGAEIAGTPTVIGTFDFTIRAENPAGFDEQAFGIVIEAISYEGTLTVQPDEFAVAVVGATVETARAEIGVLTEEFGLFVAGETSPPGHHATIGFTLGAFGVAVAAATIEPDRPIDLPSIDGSSQPTGPAYVELFDPTSTLDLDLPSIDGSSLPAGVVVEHYPIVEVPFQPVTTVELYNRIGGLLSPLENASGVRWQDPFNDIGSGSVTLPLDDPDSALLAATTEVRCYLYGELVYAWVLARDPTVTAIAEGEEAAQEVTATGDGRVSLLGRARVYPVKGTAAQLMGQHRLYSFASPDFPNDATWPAAWQNLRQDVIDPIRHSDVEVVVDHILLPDTHDFVTAPAPLEWPVPTAYWIWNGPDTLPIGFCYFRGSFDLTIETALEIACTADNYWTLYLDGNPILGETGTTSTWQEYKTVSLKLPAGHYTLAAAVENVFVESLAPENNPAGFLCAVYTLDDNKDLLDTIKVSDNSWTCLGYPPTVPGWTPGQILIDAIAEAQARGGLDGFSYDFGMFADSSGGPWQTTDPAAGSYVPGFSIPVGGTVLDVLTSLKDQGWIDFRVKPGGLVLQVWSQGHAGHDSGVVLAQTMDTATQNIVSETFAPQGDPVTRLLVKWSQGFFQLDDFAAQVTWGTYEGFVTIDADNEAEARRQAQLVLDELSDPQTSIVIETDPVGLDDRPYLSYANGDRLTIPDRSGAPVSKVLLSITVDETDMGRPTIVLEFGVRVLERQREQNKLFDTLGRGVTGNTKIRIPLTETSDVSNG